MTGPPIAGLGDATHLSKLTQVFDGEGPVGEAWIRDIENTNGRHGILKGITDDGGATWTWQPITSGSTEENLRPIVPPGHGYRTMVLWEMGRYTSYEDYKTSILCARDVASRARPGVNSP